MLIVIVVFLLVLGIAFFQALQGAYSSIIMALLVTLCAGLAFSYYRPVAMATLQEYQPGYAQGAALVVLFTAPLLVLRILSDRFLGRNVVMSVWVDRTIGGTLGIYTAMVMVGVAMVAVQMLPWKGTMLLYKPYDDTLMERPRSILVDEFALGVVNMLSSQSMANDPPNRFADSQDNLILALYAAHNTGTGVIDPKMSGASDVDPLDGSTVATTECMKVENAYEPTAAPWLNVPENRMLGEPAPDTKVILVRYLIMPEGDRNETILASDADKHLRLAATQFRLIARSGNSYKSYYPLAYATHNSGAWMLHTADRDTAGSPDGKLMIARLAVVRPLDQMGKLPAAVDWVYRIRATDTPSAFVFRNEAVGSIGPVKPGLPPGEATLKRK